MTTVVFDLGGVLYDFKVTPLTCTTSKLGLAWTEIFHDWTALVREFEVGGRDAQDFARTAVATYGLEADTATFIERFRAVAAGFLPGALDLVREVSVHHRVVSLSNTNDVHWPVMLSGLPPADPFHRHFPSHLSGFPKPDPRGYQALAAHLGDDAYLFLDDRSENVAAARALGWQAHQVQGVAEAAAVLARSGLLTPPVSRR